MSWLPPVIGNGFAKQKPPRPRAARVQNTAVQLFLLIVVRHAEGLSLIEKFSIANRFMGRFANLRQSIGKKNASAKLAFFI
jgi:hypothetical protein